MRISISFVAWLAAIAVTHAQPDPPTAEPEAAAASQREIALDNLLSERESVAALAKAIEEARKNGVSEQAVLEARFLYHVDQQEDAAIAAMLPDFIKQQAAFKLEDSAIFGVKEDWLAVTEYVKAIASLEKGDDAAFKTHITEAFWLSPRQASAFATHIDRMRLEERMREVKLDFTTRLTRLEGGDAVPLQDLIADKKAMLFHFWSPASTESAASMPDFIVTAKALITSDIPVASILPGEPPAILTEARTTLRPWGPNPPGAWLIDNTEAPLARDLRVQHLPLFVLISNEGRVLFNGDPSDAAFWEALLKIVPGISRPQAADDAR